MKPTVRYIPSASNLIKSGRAARITLIVPAKNRKCASYDTCVWTSAVLAHDTTTGCFETMSTKYVPSR